jgi:hypothetical protein
VNEKPTVLEKKLRSEQPCFSPGSGFTERVMDQLPARPLPLRRSSARPSALRFVVGVAVAASLAFLLLQLLPRDARLPVAPAIAKSEPDPKQLELPKISMAQVQELTAKLDEPLQNELKNVISDTRQAIQFIASNFLPEN